MHIFISINISQRTITPNVWKDITNSDFLIEIEILIEAKQFLVFKREKKY